MARRKQARTTKRQGSSTRSTRKSEAEARVERITWFLLVAIFGIINLLPTGSLPNALVPLAGALVLLGSGLYQYSRRWRVSPTTWIAGSVMMVMGLYSIYVNPQTELIAPSLLAFAIVIGIGVLTGET